MKKNSGIPDSGILDLLESGNGRKNGPQSTMFKWRCSLNISPQVAACIFFFFFFFCHPSQFEHLPESCLLSLSGLNELYNNNNNNNNN